MFTNGEEVFIVVGDYYENKFRIEEEFSDRNVPYMLYLEQEYQQDLQFNGACGKILKRASKITYDVLFPDSQIFCSFFYWQLKRKCEVMAESLKEILEN